MYFLCFCDNESLRIPYYIEVQDTNLLLLQDHENQANQLFRLRQYSTDQNEPEFSRFGVSGMSSTTTMKYKTIHLLFHFYFSFINFLLIFVSI